MENPKNLDLIWEKTFGGAVGIYKPQKKIAFTPALMKKLAISKMTDVVLISADFDDAPVVFTPLVWLLLDSGASVEFFGVYATELSNNKVDSNSNELENLPAFCIKKAFWSKLEDIKNFQLADDKKKYILGATQTFSNIVFINFAHCPETTQLVEEVIQVAKHGLSLQENQNESVYEEIKINVSDGRFYLNFSYHPRVVTNNVLEQWIFKWRNCIDKLPLDMGYLPDEKVRISYELSLFDKVSMFDKIQG
ncbi:MAG: hypothetical protein KME06_17980 [Kastovskya adunca ATA6-11-RM4]|jgi:hypothetical protein|nr:hypothetical protein [Kastovskya adunca ATA6-11-RM4]